MSFLDLFRRKKVDPEAARRARLRTTGRIADGSILDVTSDAAQAITHVFYCYTVNSVEYESSQQLDQEQLTHSADYFPGAHITVRYDPRQPGNSIVV
ncbi:MAG TPA: hypothetical protein VGB17_11550 [Pyrinomonadaceae bacterium]|jgi:hypothetical protein